MRRFREKNPDYRQKESEYHKNYYSERRKDPSFISAIREKNRQQYLKRKMKKMAAESESSSNPDHDSASTIRMEEGPEGEGSDKASPSRKNSLHFVCFAKQNPVIMCRWLQVLSIGANIGRATPSTRSVRATTIDSTTVKRERIRIS